MTIKEANAIDMVSYMSMQGYEPANIKGQNYWYYSPFRVEKTPSFKINRSRNQWYDFAEGRGGNLIDFMQQWKSGSVTEALQLLKAVGISANPMIISNENKPAIKILSTHNVSSFPLVSYYRSRRIVDEIANHYLQEIRYKNGNKIYYSLGFRNDAGGYELRSQYFKGSASPKGPTIFKNKSSTLSVFEGFFDFLSYLSIYQNQAAPLIDFLVLNSTSFFEMQLPIMQSYQQVHLYLDNDATGNKWTSFALEKHPQLFCDERSLFAGYKDLSDWYQQIGTNLKPPA